jgi:osmoprotectant transport system ATP-binding protein
MIKLANATKKYGGVAAVDSLSLEVNKGDVCVLIGPSGCGKSTVIKLINRMLEPTSGSIYIDGKNVNSFKPEILRRQIGYVIQSTGLFPHMTVGENVAVVPVLLAWDKNKIAVRVDELLQLIGLEPEKYKNKYPHELSGGEAQRVGVARALAADPKILLMDEPFGAVDPLNKEKLHAEFVRIQKELKKTVVFVTHFIDEAIRLADRIAVMKSGKLVQYDTPENLLAYPANEFIHDFIGADRSLKRLLRFYAKHFMKPANSSNVSTGLDRTRAGFDREGFIWMVGVDGKLLGWTDTGRALSSPTVEEAIAASNPAELAVKPEATLEVALSKMLGLGLKRVAVVDEDFKLLGEVRLEDIEKVTHNGESA